MLKKVLALLVMLYAAVAFAAVDVNKGTAAELDGVKGIGPAISKRIIDERKKGNFKDWNDFIARVNGIGEKTAASLSSAGLTVGGASYTAAAPAKAAAKDEKKADAKVAAAPKDDKKADAKPAAAAPKDDKKPAADAKTAEAPKAAASAAKK